MSKPRTQGISPSQAAAASSRINSNATPKAVLDAFFPARVTSEDFVIQPVNLATFMALEKINSPLAVSGSNRPEITAEDIARALVILTLPATEPEDIARLRAVASDPETITELSWSLAARVPASELLALGPKITARISSAFETILPTKSPGESSGGPFPVSHPEGQPSDGR